MIRRPPRSTRTDTLCPYTTLFRSEGDSTRIAGYLPFNPDRYQYYSLSHATPIGSNGLTQAAQAAHVETRSRDSRTTGEATLAGLTLSYPVLRSTKPQLSVTRSEERRVGKECVSTRRSRWSRNHHIQNQEKHL